MTKKGKKQHQQARRILAERPATKCETAGETTTDMQPEPLPITPPPAVPATGEKLIPPPIPESNTPPDDDDLFSQIREDGTVNGKPRFLIRSKAVINMNSDFLHKLLCDGLTFTAGHACVFSCLFCYVIEQMRKNAKFNALLQARGLRHEDVVVEIEDAAAMARQALTFADGTPRFTDPNDKRVIYASPLVDVAGNVDQVKVTIEICLVILELTHWQIRLLSKSSLLLKVADALSDYKDRLIFGFSTGTLEDNVTKGFETGTALVSKRLAALKKLQDQGFRTFGMLCPILPQTDYPAYARKVAEKIDIGKWEHVWAEVLNDRGGSLTATSKGLRQAGFTEQADLMDLVARDKAEWNKYAEDTFRALADVIPPEKLRFLQYVDQSNYHVWKKHEARGAVLLGKYATRMSEASGNGHVKKVELLDSEDKAALAKYEAIIHGNGKQFVEVGLALKQILDRELYSETHTNFEAYCLGRFDFGKGYGYRLINSAVAFEELKPQLKLLPIGNTLLPTSESQMRELLKVEPEDRVKVLEKAAEMAGGKPINALLIESAAAALKPVAVSKQAKVEYPAPVTYTTNLNVFLGWVATLQNHTREGNVAEVLRLLTKAQTNQAIIPEMPPMITFADPNLPFGWLSAMSPHPLEYEGKSYLTTEALFQCLRFDGHPDIQKVMIAQKSPVGVTHLVRKHRDRLRGFDAEVNLRLMRLCLNLKLEQHHDLRDRLRETGDKLIVDDCTNRAKGQAFFWGMALVNGQWVGENWMGKLWTELRDKLNKSKQ